MLLIINGPFDSVNNVYVSIIYKTLPPNLIKKSSIQLNDRFGKYKCK